MAQSRAFAILAAVALAPAPALLCTGCEGPPPRAALNYSKDAKLAYEDALEDMKAKSWIEATAKLKEVKRKFGYSKYARLAELRLADIDFELEKFPEAARAYRQFVHDHRSDAEEVAYARSRIAEAQVKQISESIILPSSEERDQAAVLDAFKELRGYLHDYPEARESKRMRALLTEVTARLVRHELYVARFYLARDNFEAAVNRILYALKNYARTNSPSELEAPEGDGMEPDAVLLLGETYLKMHHWRDARDAFALVIRRYPSSPMVDQAQRYLGMMQQRGV